MKIRTMKELLTPEPRTLAFSPHGLLFGHKTMDPEASVEYLQQMVLVELAAGVPDAVRVLYDRLRALFPYGLWAYELFTVLREEAHLVLETALQFRLIEYYGYQVPLVNIKTPADAVLPITYYDDLDTALRPRGSHERRGGWRLRGHDRFDGSFAALLRWARAEGLFYGQRNYVVEAALLELRNFAAHPKPVLITPVDAARALTDLGELVNHLWADEPGHLYPPPVPRRLWAVGFGLDQTPGIVGPVEGFASHPEEYGECDTIYLAVAADADSGQLAWDTRWVTLATTAYPAKYLWGPGTLEDARYALNAYAKNPFWQPDTVSALDQVFWVRRDKLGRWSFPRRSDQLKRVDPEERNGTWHEVIADSPMDLWENIQVAHELPELGENPVPKLPQTMKAPHITTQWRGSWQELQLRLAMQPGAGG